jgi:hypothetical protein
VGPKLVQYHHGTRSTGAAIASTPCRSTAALSENPGAQDTDLDTIGSRVGQSDAVPTSQTILLQHCYSMWESSMPLPAATILCTRINSELMFQVWAAQTCTASPHIHSSPSSSLLKHLSYSQPHGYNGSSGIKARVAQAPLATDHYTRKSAVDWTQPCQLSCAGTRAVQGAMWRMTHVPHRCLGPTDQSRCRRCQRTTAGGFLTCTTTYTHQSCSSDGCLAGADSI